MKKRYVITLVLLMVIGSLIGCPPAPPPPASVPEQVRPLAKTGESPDELIKKLEDQVKRLEAVSKASSPEAQLDESQTHNFDLSTGSAEGPETAKLTMVVWSDFECPFCQKFAVTSRAVAKKFPTDLRIVFMNFPLQDECNEALNRPFHTKACMAAYASKAAKEQGKFWEMHDWLFQNQRTISPETILAFAAQAGMDAAKIKEAMDTQKYKDELKAEARQLAAAGGRGTPSAFINGKKVLNVRWDNQPAVEEFITKLLNPAPETATPETGVKPAVTNPGELPQASIVLSDGTRLEDRLQDLVQRLAKVGSESPAKDKPKPKPEPKNPDPNMTYKFNLDGRPAAGPDNAAATLVVFTDFTCPYCSRMSEVYNELRKEYPNDLRVVFKNTPNPGHKFSIEAHETGMEAMAQGKFWELHDVIFKNRDKLSPEYLRQIAQEAGLNMEQYDKAMTEHTHRQQIIMDVQEADAAKVNATPTTFLNGKYQPNASKETLTAAIKTITGK